jgi:hypothetical protein
MNKKRTRDSDMLEPLGEGQEDLPESLDFHPILNPEVRYLSRRHAYADS